MQQAFRKSDRKRLTALLPEARGHALEPWAAYWELKARLDEASAQEVQDFMRRYADSYQEDRLRNDWLKLLGQRRDWAGFAAEYPKFRMNDDREVRCYALLVEHLKNPVMDARLSEEVRKNWYAQRDADDGCTAAAERLVGSKNLTSLDVWQKARLAMEGNRPKAARDAVQIVAPEALAMGLANRVVGAGQALDAAVALARQIAAFPQDTLRADRLSALTQWDWPLAEALHREWTRGSQRLADALQGAARFAGGAGRHGEF